MDGAHLTHLSLMITMWPMKVIQQRKRSQCWRVWFYAIEKRGKSSKAKSVYHSKRLNTEI